MDCSTAGFPVYITQSLLKLMSCHVMELLYDPVIPFLYSYPKEQKTENTQT